MSRPLPNDQTANYLNYADYTNDRYGSNTRPQHRLRVELATPLIELSEADEAPVAANQWRTMDGKHHWLEIDWSSPMGWKWMEMDRMAMGHDH